MTGFSAPQRIQRKRTKGWRMPEGAVYVGRPTRWGNPFHAEGVLLFGALDENGYAGWCMTCHPGLSGQEATLASVSLYGDLVQGYWNPGKVSSLSDREYSTLYADISAWRTRIGGHPLEAARRELRGYDLACWCPLDRPCHADVLLELANR